jgi:hypothetical protein
MCMFHYDPLQRLKHILSDAQMRIELYSLFGCIAGMWRHASGTAVAVRLWE